MKRNALLITFVVLIVAFASTHAQNSKNSGSGFAYQAVLRDLNGDVFDKKEVKLTFSLYVNEAEPSAQWSQTKTLTTDQFGVVKTIVGKGDDDKVPAEGFAGINFSMAQYWFKVELQLDETEKREISFAQLPSMPYAESAFSVSFTMPVGSIMPYAGSADNIPEGWLLCDGERYNIDDYPILNDVLAGYWNIDSSTGEFNVPDLRGSFLRGLDNGANVDPEATRILGSKQEYAVDVKNLAGTLKVSAYMDWYSLAELVGGAFSAVKNNKGKGLASQSGSSLYGYDITFNIPKDYQIETRPVNHAVNYIIKY